MTEITYLKIDRNKAYDERNMLTLLIAEIVNSHNLRNDCGWYYDTDNNFEGFKRVISLLDGKACFHIPDEFDVGELKEIQPNWDGHTTEQKWETVRSICGCKDGKS